LAQRPVCRKRDRCLSAASLRTECGDRATELGIWEIYVTDNSFYVAFSTFNVLLLLTTSIVLVSLYARARQLTQSTRLLTELAGQMARIDRHSASEVALIAREISSDIERLRELDGSSKTEGPVGMWQLHPLDARDNGLETNCFFCQAPCSDAPLIEGKIQS
jgi:hypothetical protein